MPLSSCLLNRRLVASTGLLFILSRHAPIASKFSNAIPHGSIREWQGKTGGIVAVIFHPFFESHLQDVRVSQINFGDLRAGEEGAGR